MPAPTIVPDPTQTIVPRRLAGLFTPINPIRQVETATVVGAITTAGNATVTVTATGLTGSPVALTVAVALNDTASQVAAKIRAAAAANVNIAAMFFVGGGGSEVVLTKKVGGANDATLNIAIANGTSVGLTAAPTSDDTVAGVAANVEVQLWGKLADYDSKITSVSRKVPSPIDGTLRVDRNVLIEQEEFLEFELEDIRSILVGLFGSMSGSLVQGYFQAYISDPDDASGTVVAKSNYYRCTAELSSGISFKVGEFSTAKVKFMALEKLHIKPNAAA